MASPAQVNPNWTPPPRKRSVFGPIVLIAAGILLLLVSSGRLSAREFFRLFADYWPVVLIIWGAVKLLEHMQAKREGLPAPGIGAGGVVLLIFFILFGTAISAARHGMERVDWNKVGDHVQFGDEDMNEMFGGNKYQYDETLERDFPAKASLKVAVDRGEINVTTSSDEKIHILVKKTVYADSDAEGKKQSDAFSPNITVANNLMNVEALPRGDWKGRVDLQISLPRRAAVDLMTLKGMLTVTGRDGEVKAHNSNGDVSIDDVANNVTAHMRSGSFNVKNVKGDVNLEGRGNDVNVTDTKGKLTLQGEYDQIQVGKVEKGLHFNSTRTDMESGKIDGEISMSSGELRGNGLTGFRISTRSKDIDLEDVSGDVKVEDTNGSVQITPKDPVANIDVTNKNGEVNLLLPSGGNFTVDASAMRGEIETEFDLNKGSNQSHETHVTGTIGKGGPRVQIRDDNGTIHIRKK
jgi:hypothetical protein